MAKSFMDSLNSAILAWIPEVSRKIQTDFQVDAGAKLAEVSLSKDGQGFRLDYEIPDKSETNIPTVEQQIWVPASTYVTKDKKTGRRVTRKRKGYMKTIKAEVSNLDRTRAITQEGDKPKSGANSAYRVVELALDYNFGDDFPNFLQTYLKSKGWDIERKK